MSRQILRDEKATTIELGYILNLVVLMIFTSSIIGAFYVRADASSQHSQRAEFTDLGNEIARDITNIYLTSLRSSDNNLSVIIKREIPLTIGGKGYAIELEKATSDNMAYVVLKEGNYKSIAILNSIDTHVNLTGIVYSGSGEMTIKMTKNSAGTLIWIE